MEQLGYSFGTEAMYVGKAMGGRWLDRVWD